jgi:hypothetical protein
MGDRSKYDDFELLPEYDFSDGVLPQRTHFRKPRS